MAATFWIGSTASGNATFFQLNHCINSSPTTTNLLGLSLSPSDVFVQSISHRGDGNAEGQTQNNSWEDAGTDTFEAMLSTTNSDVDMRCRITKTDSAGSTVESSSYTSAQTMSADRTFSITLPTWSGSEAYTHWIKLQCEQTNTAGHGGAKNFVWETSSDSLTGQARLTTSLTILQTAGTIRLEQDSFRFRNDDGSESAATWKEAADTDTTFAKGTDTDTNFRLRFLVSHTASGSTTTAKTGFQLQRSLNSGTWTDVDDSSSVVKTVLSSNFANKDNTTQQLGSGTLEGTEMMCEINGIIGRSDPTSAADSEIATTEEAEVEFCLQVINADVAGSDTIDLRLIHGCGVAFHTYTQTPRIDITGAAAARQRIRIID